jgi:hypothetical protein
VRPSCAHAELVQAGQPRAQPDGKVRDEVGASPYGVEGQGRVRRARDREWRATSRQARIGESRQHGQSAETVGEDVMHDENESRHHSAGRVDNHAGPPWGAADWQPLTDQRGREVQQGAPVG